MINLLKLEHMHSGFRRRKTALTLGALERDISGSADQTLLKSSFFATVEERREYVKKLVRIVSEDSKLSEAARSKLTELLCADTFDERRACNYARNCLLEAIGCPSAEWDLIIAPHAIPSAQQMQQSQTLRPFYQGLFVYAEDIRSPFNMGSVFRTAEAFGAEKLFLSPLCTDPKHPRAVRSAMGCTEFLAYERCPLEKIRTAMPDLPVFALETGGTPIKDFIFPQKGIVIIGSEELGISPEALAQADYGTVTVPMTGIKASLNVGVAFGILMHAWTQSMQSRSTSLQI